MMSPNQFEQAILELEHVRIVVRAPPMLPSFEDFAYIRQCSDDTLVKTWLEDRIKPLVNTACVVVTGYGTTAPPRMKMGTLRKTYER